MAEETRLNKLLVCLQMDESDAQVLRAAGELARLVHATEVVFAYTVETGLAPAQIFSKHPTLAAAPEIVLARMRRAVDVSFDGPAGLSLRFEVRSGTPVRELTRLAAVEDVDLILVAQPRMAPDLPFAGRRLAARMAYKSHCSLLSIPPNGQLKLERVLVPVRNSECSQRALETAIALASAATATPEIIAHYVYTIMPDYTRAGLSFDDFEEELRDFSRAEVAELMKSVDVGRAQIKHLLTADPMDNPARLIVNAVGEAQAGMVVIGSRGRTGAAGVILGHVTEALIMSSPVPVLAVKKKGENLSLLQAIGVLI